MSDYSPQIPTEERPERRERRRGSSGVLVAVALIVLGGAILMGNMGIVTINWEEASRYWPVLLILVGLDVMIGRRSVLGSAVVAVVTIVALLGVLWLSGQVPIRTTEPPPGPVALFSPGKPVTGYIQEKLGSAKKLVVNVELSQMALKLGSSEDAGQAAGGDWSTIEGLEPTISYKVDGETGVLTVRQPDSNDRLPPFALDSQMRLNLPPGIPIELNVNDDLGAVTLDLAKLSITSLDVSASSGNQDITLPEVGQMGSVSVHGDLGSVTVKAPDKATLNMDTLDVSSSSGALTLGLPGKGTIDELSVKGDLGAVTVTIPDDATLQLGPANFESSSGNLRVQLPANGKAGDVTLTCDLGSLALEIPGSSNTLSVDKLDVNASSGSITLTLPGGKGNYPADIQDDLGGVTITLPASLDVFINVEEGLAKPNMASSRLNKIDDRDWQTSGYSGTGDSRALVTVNASSGQVTVKDE